MVVMFDVCPDWVEVFTWRRGVFELAGVTREVEHRFMPDDPVRSLIDGDPNAENLPDPLPEAAD